MAYSAILESRPKDFIYYMSSAISVSYILSLLSISMKILMIAKMYAHPKTLNPKIAPALFFYFQSLFEAGDIFFQESVVVSPLKTN